MFTNELFMILYKYPCYPLTGNILNKIYYVLKIRYLIVTSSFNVVL